MPNYTLDSDSRTLTHNGDILWSTYSAWSSYPSWTQHTSTSTVAETGATGTPLYFQTEIIDLGSSLTVYPEINYSGQGDVRAVIEFSDNSDLSSASFLGKYTTDNAKDTEIVVYDVLDYQDAGYTNEDSSTNSNYSSFTARYVRFTAFVDDFNEASTSRDVQTLESFNWSLKTDTIQEQLSDVSVSGDTAALTFSEIGTVLSMNITPHSAANKKLVGQIVNKTNKTIRVVDANSFSVSGVSATVDVSATGVPGRLEASTEGVGKV